MAAKELSRSFDLQHGSVTVQVWDDLGQTSPHTIYVLGTPDVDATVARILADTDARTTLIQTAMAAAGFVAPTS